MTLFVAMPAGRNIRVSIPALFCALLAFSGCGKSSSDSGSGDDGGSSSQGGGGTQGGGASGQGGGAQGGSSGDTTGGGADPGGAGGVDSGGGADAGGSSTGGTTGSGGTAGASGMAGAAGAGAGGAGSDACVNVSGGGVEPWYDLAVYGTEFDAEDGERMRVVVASQSPYRVGIADVPIVDGAFALSMPEVLNAGLYVGITLYVDRNENDTCETEEHLWNWTTRSVIGDMRFDVTPDELCDDTLMNCRPHDTTPPCFVGAGDTDPTESLPCNP